MIYINCSIDFKIGYTLFRLSIDVIHADLDGVMVAGAVDLSLVEFYCVSIYRTQRDADSTLMLTICRPHS